MISQQEKQFLQLALGIEMLQQIGFEPAQNATLPKKLKSISPSGSTAMRDSIACGIKLLIQLNQVLQKLESNKYWQFVHIVLTDGDDTSSKVELKQLGALMYLIGQTIDVKQLKTYLIGIDLEQDEKALKELLALRILGGENCEIKTSNNMDVNQIFKEIQISIQKQRQMIFMQSQNMTFVAGSERPVLNIESIKYIVLFNLDISGSMSGSRWNKVCQCVQELTSKLGKGDLIGCITFNDKCDILKPSPQLAISNNSNQQQQKQYQSQQQTYQKPQQQQSSPKPQPQPQKKKDSSCIIF